MLRRFASHIHRWCLALWRARDAVAAVEFAIVFPVALLLYVGSAEISDAVNTSRKVESLSRTVVDLLSQEPTSAQALSTPPPASAMTPTALQNLMTASAGLIYPAPTSTLQVTLTAIDISNNSSGYCCVIKVRWSYTQNGTLRPCNVSLTAVDPSLPPSPTTIPNNLTPYYVPLPSPISLLVADVSYSYQPIMSTNLMSIGNMSRTSYILPRSLGQVIVQGPLPTTGAQTGAICY